MLDGSMQNRMGDAGGNERPPLGIAARWAGDAQQALRTEGFKNRK